MSFDEEHYKEIKSDFLRYFDSFLEEITVANWSVGYKRKDELSQLGEPQKAQMIVTFDNKIVLFQPDVRSISF